MFIACPCEPSNIPVLEDTDATISLIKDTYALNDEIVLTISFTMHNQQYINYELDLNIQTKNNDSYQESSDAYYLSEENEIFTKKTFNFFITDYTSNHVIQKKFYLKAKQTGTYFYIVSVTGNKNYAKSSVTYFKRFVIHYK